MTCSKTKKKKILIITLLVVGLIFVFCLNTKIESHKNEIAMHRKVFDFRVETFEKDQFDRIRSYVNLISDHYGQKVDHDSIKAKDACPELENKFIKSIKEYALNRTDKNYFNISKILREIREKDRIDSLKYLYRCGAGPLTLSVFFLAPLPSTFIYPMQIEILKNCKDTLLLYVGMLRQPSLFRFYMPFHKWLETFDQPEFSKMFGNVLNFRENVDISGRIAELIPELGLTNYSGDFDASLKASKIKTIKIFSGQDFTNIRLNVNIDDIIRGEYSQVDGDTKNTNFIVARLGRNSTTNFSQISEIINLTDKFNFYLKAMVIKQPDTTALMVFDPIYQIWTLFKNDKVILSFPRQYAKKYFNQFGTHLIYFKQ